MAFDKVNEFDVADVPCGVCPFGQPGDRLWVRETWRTDKSLDGRAPTKFSAWPVMYYADRSVLNHGSFHGSPIGKKRPSIHMPRWASRITLEITDVRVERLQEISESDCELEGLKRLQGGIKIEYRCLWESLHKAKGFRWDENPWVWVISFKRIK
jgi:hypothetical protein